MKLSSLVYGMVFAVVVICVVLLILGVNFHRPVSGQGAALYNPAEEITVKGVVREVQEFDCPVSEGELGSHVMLKTSDGTWQVHLAPVRVMAGQKLTFAPGDQLQVIGSKIKVNGTKGVIAREVVRGNETYTFRDPSGKLMLSQ
jgi:DNA/RNA endonuclease YhcR with UshA esterase domain